MFDNILKRIRKPLSIEYINKQLRAKGIATNLKGENNLTFKLYDMNWDLYCEKDRLGLRNSFNIGNDTDKECLLKAANKLNNDRWIVKAFIDEYIPEEDEQKGKETISSIIFSFESFCTSETDFSNLYEFAIYAMTDAIEFHRKCYTELLKEKEAASSNTPIGFNVQRDNNENSTVAENKKTRTKIGFV